MAKPNRHVENGFGITGTAVLLAGCVHGALLLTDWIGRIQTVMAVEPYLGKLMSAPAFIVELIIGFLCLYVALKLERIREKDEAPLVILAYAIPEEPKQHWWWLKLPVSIATAIVIVALGAGTWIRFSRAGFSPDVVKTPSKQSAPAEATRTDHLPDAPKPKQKPTRAPNSVATAPASTGVKADSKSSTFNPRKDSGSVAVSQDVAPVPKSIPQPPNSENTTVASVGGKTIDPSLKRPGSFYVVVLVSSITRYTGSPSPTRIQEVVNTLQAMKDMEVFYAGNNGYMLRTNGVPSGFNGSLSAADRPGLILFVSFRQARVNQLGPVSA